MVERGVTRRQSARQNEFTRDIVGKYMNNYLPAKFHQNNTRDDNNDEVRFNSDQEYCQRLDEVCRSLAILSNELKSFVKEVHKDRFKDLTSNIVTEIKDDRPRLKSALKKIADELFSQGINWSHIVTFLVFCAELQCRSLEISNNTNGARLRSLLNNWICKYIDENLMQWIDEQEGGWLDVTAIITERENKKKSIRNYMSVAAIAAFVGGLYLCSKFTAH